MSRKRVWILLLMGFIMLAFAACGNGKEKKDEAKIRKVAQKYFDALKVGDQEGEYDCYLPGERQKRDAETGLLGFASKLILKVDIGEALSDWNTLFGEENAFAKYKYKATDVDLDEDGADAVAYIDVYDGEELCGILCVNMTKYDDAWFVVKGTIANDDRIADQTESGGDQDEESGIADDEDRAENIRNNGNKIAEQILLPVLIAVIILVVVTIMIFIYRSQSSKKRRTTESPFVELSGDRMEPADIMCSCGTINPMGVRTCMGCGKKLKKRR